MNIKLEEVSFSYNQNEDSPPVLNEICFEIKSGDFVGIVGPTGSGKTTLLELICGFLKPFSGKVLFDGIDIYSDKRERMNFFNAFQTVKIHSNSGFI